MFSLAFLYPLVFFVQPGVLWPELAPFLPLQIVSGLVLLTRIAPRGEYSRKVAFGSRAFRWMLAFMVVQALSVINEGVSSLIGEAAYVAPLAQFVILSLMLTDSPPNLRRYLWGMTCGSLWLVFYGIYALHAGLRVSYGSLAGAYGNYENHNDYTFIIIQVLPFAYALRNELTNRLGRLLMGVALLACMYGTVLSQSRGGMIALVLEILLIVMLTMTPKRRAVLLPIVVLLGLGAISYQYAIRAATNGDNYTAEDAENSRFELWKAGGNMVLAHPLIGIGNRRFGEMARDYGELSHDQIGKNSHNTYIEVAATTGLLGFFAFMKMLGSIRREVKTPFASPEALSMDNLRIATLIALYSIIFRAFLDAKDHDWSFYLFVVIAAAMAMHRRRYDPLPKEPEMFDHHKPSTFVDPRSTP